MSNSQPSLCMRELPSKTTFKGAPVTFQCFNLKVAEAMYCDECTEQLQHERHERIDQGPSL